MRPPFAEHRIRDHIASFKEEKPRRGLERVDGELRRSGATPSERLHYIAAVSNLSRIAERTRQARLWRASEER